MTAHDIVAVEGDGCVVCACGRRFDAGSLGESRVEHGTHFGLELVRAALKEATS